MRRPALAVSLGCPAGVGPELAVRAAARRLPARCVLVGDHELIRAETRARRIAARRLRVVGAPGDIVGLESDEIGLWAESQPLGEPVQAGRPTPAAGVAALRWIEQACDLAATGSCDGLVTGPVSKAVIAQSGAPRAKRFTGHTEYLARRVGASEVVMAFSAPALTTALVTTHLPLAEVPGSITAPRVARACYWLVRLLQQLGVPAPQVAVAALNPHGGEDGMLGAEERRRITPGMQRARQRLGRTFRGSLVGPMGAESAFRHAVAGRFHGVVAMYHDQATIPCKVVGFGQMVNVTLGLPIVRTSVDHGTAYDLAGTGHASVRSMLAALQLAARLARAHPAKG